MGRSTLAALLLASAVAHAQQPPAYGCDGPESKQLDFWVGEWEASYAGPNNTAGKSRNRITKIMDGCVVLEEFAGAPGTKLNGHSVSTFDRATKQWKQTWVDNTASYLDFESAIVDGNFAFVRTVTRNGKASHQRMVWRDVKPDSLTWLWQSSPDGQAWTTQWEIAYTRAK